MDKSWMSETNRLSKRYVDGVNLFLEFARAHTGSEVIRCPCRECLNIEEKKFDVVESHLYAKGISQSYTRWINHGEQIVGGYSHDTSEDVVKEANVVDDDSDGDDIFDILEDVHRAMFTTTKASEERNESNQTLEGDGTAFYKLLKDAQCELYPGCKKFSALSFIVELLHLKVTNHWSNKSFDMLLKLLTKCSPNANIPSCYSEANKKLHGLGLGYNSIHACKYDCALFWKEYEGADFCPECGESRWKRKDDKDKGIPHKVLRYFPLTPRLKRMYVSRHIAEDMRWHKEKRVDNEGVMRHPADSVVWKQFDSLYPWFAKDPRNIRSGLTTDGFNPFGSIGNSYSMWLIVLMPYNLPPWRCMKESSFMMSLLIPGRNAPNRDIDVYMQPLIAKLKELWEQGVDTYDAFSREVFRLHASILWTINDFLVYANLSGWSTRGYAACPVCKEDKSSHRLRNKICYIGHRRFLPQTHHWRKSKAFNGKVEKRFKPVEQSGYDILQQVNGLKNLRHRKCPEHKMKKRKK
ncbi:hypothetical protein Scep_007003 [Stephania cephalantha]|uniref:Transposase-associated domain-containing protein n=1 Tax=Stephania cephalantha TaxID=152367 RepID=A0AAP0K984_9MAGN